MSLINYKKNNFIFFHLYKCGGNSLRTVLNERYPDSVEWGGVHGLPADVKTHYINENKLEVFNKSFKFTIIRNPFDFLVSTYFYGKSYPAHFMHYTIHNENMSMLEFIPYYMRVRSHNFGLDGFTADKPLGANKVVTFNDWLHDSNGEPIMDFIGKIENINIDTNIILEHINKNNAGAKIRVPIVNVNPNKQKDYRQYYNPESRKLVEKHFAWELENFKYKF
mgnify:CR=1 FL=1